MATATVQQGQNLMDFSIQHLGDMTGVFELAKKNGLGITEDITPGSKLLLPSVINGPLVEYLKSKNAIPATQAALAAEQLQGGIDFMQIETTFIVS